jgi:hypothetical protein
MFIITEKLDKIASVLESKGYLKEAEELDVLSNTLEAMEVEAFNVEMSPLYKLLSNIFKAIRSNNLKAALGFHQQGNGLKDQIYKSYGSTPEGAEAASKFAKDYEEIKTLLESGKVEDAVNKIKEALASFKNLATTIKKDYSGQRRINPDDPGQSNLETMVFSPHKSKSPAGRVPLAPPARALRE